MTRILTFVVAASLSSPLFAQAPAATPAKQSPAQQAQAYFERGQLAEKAGDPVAAKLAYQEALKLNPNHANARYSLGQVKLDSGNIAAKGREAKFGEVMIPEFNLAEATLVESLDFLRTIIEKQSNGKVTPNFVIQDPKNQLAATKIDLKLKNTPARGVMKYLMDLAGAKAKYDEFAIVITPQ